ncbi:hypothetical protein OCC_03172 [Thermococcus litoralis DSM 5473]|uniref:Uncharacterized protein n=1 Tax=Thermococcus litoralis (strain ATCC 51850 / DSM 5473 / JCM 8560 / NS-C) TaxID=523849 RepID=H3ZQ56_THELN|nr:hypothetical protein [Thermococcus litoralis]EHR77850.2 hypothetical protein OCC_03172 [Thermococcus litoralis DSM 5473]
MLRWVVLGIVGLLVFSSFGFVFAQEVKSLQVSSETCSACSSCRDFDVDKALSEANAKIENLTRLINQKEAELHKLYAELNKTKSIETLEKIVKLEDEIQLLKSDLEFYKRQELSLELIKKYTRRTPYGVEVLYYRLPREDELVKQYIEKVHPVRKDVDLDWFIAFYRQAGELTFDEYVVTDMKLRETIGEIKAGNATVEDALGLIEEKKQIWDRIYAYLGERDKLQTLKKLKELGRKQTIMKTTGVEPLSIDVGISRGWGCQLHYCFGESSPALPSQAYLYDFQKVAVWVGMYTSSTPNMNYFYDEYCTYDFTSTYDIHEYWDKAVELTYDPILGGSPVHSIQVKWFFSAYDSDDVKHDIIWQFECDATHCWLTTGRADLPDPNLVPWGTYKLDVFENYLDCCRGCLIGCQCHWCNTHCSGCFACDPSGAQNFVHEDKPNRTIWP